MPETTKPSEKLPFGTSTLVSYSIADLFSATALCAVAIVAVRHFEILGTLALFILTVALCQGFYRIGMPFERRRFWYQVLWGIVMPLACIATDPLVFGDLTRTFDSSIHLYSHATFCYVLIAWQMLLLGCHWFWGQQASSLNAWFMGSFAIGTAFCMVLGVMLLPLSALGLIVIVGVLGFTPWVTSYIFLDLTLSNMRAINWQNHPKQQMLLAVAGTLLAILIPFVVSQISNQLVPDLFYNDLF